MSSSVFGRLEAVGRPAWSGSWGVSHRCFCASWAIEGKDRNAHKIPRPDHSVFSEIVDPQGENVQKWQSILKVYKSILILELSCRIWRKWLWVTEAGLETEKLSDGYVAPEYVWFVISVLHVDRAENSRPMENGLSFVLTFLVNISTWKGVTPTNKVWCIKHYSR